MKKLLIFLILCALLTFVVTPPASAVMSDADVTAYLYKTERVSSDYGGVRENHYDNDYRSFRAYYTNYKNTGYTRSIINGDNENAHTTTVVTHQNTPLEPIGQYRSVNGGIRTTNYYATKPVYFKTDQTKTRLNERYSNLGGKAAYPARVNTRYSNLNHPLLFRSQEYQIVGYKKVSSLDKKDIPDITQQELRKEPRIIRNDPDNFYYKPSERSTLFKNKYYNSPRLRISSEDTIYYSVERTRYRNTHEVDIHEKRH